MPLVSGSCVGPLVAWSHDPPAHPATALLVGPGGDWVVTGARDGHLITWTVDEVWKLKPKFYLLGHHSCVRNLCLAGGPDDGVGRPAYFVSASDTGEIALWDFDEGQCLEFKEDNRYIHTVIQSYRPCYLEYRLLFCVGHYPEVLVLNAMTLAPLFSLASRAQPNWIAAITVFMHPELKQDIVLGMSVSGAVSLWTLNGEENQGEIKLEHEAKEVDCEKALRICCCPQTPRHVLVITSFDWRLYDAIDWSILCSENHPPNDPFLGGQFLSIDVILLYGRSGRAYLYRLSTSASSGSAFDFAMEFTQPKTPVLFGVLERFSASVIGGIPTAHCPSAATFGTLTKLGDSCILLGVEAGGCVSVWKLTDKLLAQSPSNKGPNRILPSQVTSLAEQWKQSRPTGLGDAFLLHGSGDQHSSPTVTASTLLHGHGKLALGLSTGDILIAGTADAITALYFTEGRDPPCHLRLEGHTKQVTCLLHPASAGFHTSVSPDPGVGGIPLSQTPPPSPRPSRVSSNPVMHRPAYDPDILVSGSADLSIRVWQVSSGALLNTFYAHAAPLIGLFSAPTRAGDALRSCVVSVAEDHSAAVMSLRDRRVVTLRCGHQRSPVVGLGWKPLEDFLLLSCMDGAVFVYELGSGVLDRYETGQAAQDLYESCPFITPVRESLGQPLATPLEVSSDRCQVKNHHGLQLQALRLGLDHSLTHVLYFDTQSLIVELLNNAYHRHPSSRIRTSAMSERLSPSSMDGIGGTSPKAILKKHSVPAYLPSLTSLRPPTSLNSEPSNGGLSTDGMDDGDRSSAAHQLTNEATAILVSLLLPWCADPGLSRVCQSLGLVPPCARLHFGCVSRRGCVTLVMPGCIDEKTMHRNPNIHPYWTIASSFTTAQLTTVVSLAQAVISLPDEELSEMPPVPLYRINECGCDPATFLVGGAQRGVTVRQLWSLLSSSVLSCGTSDMKLLSAVRSPRIARLAVSWQDPCIQIREASQSLLHAYLDRLTPDARKVLMNSWSAHLPPFLRRDAETSPNISGGTRAEWMSVAGALSPGGEEASLVVDSDWWRDSPALTSAPPDQVKLQAISIIILGVLGSRYGSAGITTTVTDDGILVNIDDAPNIKSIIGVEEGFGLENYHLARCTCRALTGLVVRGRSLHHVSSTSSLAAVPQDHHIPIQSSPATNQSQAPPGSGSQTDPRVHWPLVRAAIDLLARGYSVWEPHLEIGQLLNTLLEKAANAEKLLNSVEPGNPLPNQVDTARTARWALGQIAQARPKTFIVTLSREMLRFNNHPNAGSGGAVQGSHGVSGASGPHAGSGSSQPPVMAARLEILSTLDTLCERHADQLVEVFAELVDVLLICLDKKTLCERGLDLVFPPIKKFCTVASHTRAQKVCVGSRTGAVSFFDFKLGKYSSNQGHKQPVAAVAFSPDGKQVATFSAGDNLLRIWQPSSTGIFGMGGAQAKLVTSHTLVPEGGLMTSASAARLERGVWLQWADLRTIQVVTPGGVAGSLKL